MFPVKRSSVTGWAALVALAIFGFACTNNNKKLESPSAVLEAYVKTAINAKNGSDRQLLFEYTTGDALARLKQMTDEDFFNNLVKPQFKFVHFSTRDLREEKEGGISLVYELVYENATGDSGAKITNRKIAYMTKDTNGAWKIENTRNIKSFVDMKEGMNVQYLDAGLCRANCFTGLWDGS